MGPSNDNVDENDVVDNEKDDDDDDAIMWEGSGGREECWVQLPLH